MDAGARDVVRSTSMNARRLSLAIRTATHRASPGWFTTVMGTGILAACTRLALPESPFGRIASVALFGVAAAVFVGLVVVFAITFAIARPTLRAMFEDRASALTLGAPPMAALTLAVDAWTIAPLVVAPTLCVAVAQMLFVVGALSGTLVAVVVPIRHFRAMSLETITGAWLLPVVPPVVVSVPAALLATTWPSAWRAPILAGAATLLVFGVGFAAVTIGVLATRLIRRGLLPTAAIPTLWIVVGPLGQSVAGAVALGSASALVEPEIGRFAMTSAVIYGFPVWALGVVWLFVVLVITGRTVMSGLPFSMGWWSFTFPVGTLTGASFALDHVTGFAPFGVAGETLTGLLAVTWSIVAVRTAREAWFAVGQSAARSHGAIASLNASKPWELETSA